MNRNIDYKAILVNYGSMMAEAPTKRKGLALVYEDWNTKEQKIANSIDKDLVDVGILLMQASKKRFDMEKFLETGNFPTGMAYYTKDLDHVISLFKVLKAIKEEPKIKDCLDKIMGLLDEDLDTLTVFDREDFLDKVMGEMMGYTITNLNCWTLQKLFDYYLSYIFDYELDKLLNFEDNLTEEELSIWEDFFNQYSITAIMMYMHFDLYEKIKHRVFGNGVE